MIYFKRVVGDSMYPTLKNGQIIIVSHFRTHKVGDIVVAHLNGREVVKRLTGLEGGKAFLQGDNAKNSTDSNTHGWIADRHIVGKVIFPRK